MKHFITLFIFLAAAAHAKEIFVSPSGNDRNAGTEKAPLQTVQKALDQAKSGDTIKLMPGIFREEVKITKSGAPGSPITITGTRSADGKYLSILEPQSIDCTNWQTAGEIGENVWKIKLKARPDLVMLDGKMIAQINSCNMRLNRRKNIPSIIDEKSALISV